MINNENPCQYKPCAESEIIDVNNILPATAVHPYEVFDEIQSNQRFITYNSITKFKTLKLHPNSILAINLENVDKYCVIVIETLILNDIDVNNYELLVEWFQGNRYGIMTSLRGKDGPNVRSGNEANGDGYAGSTGEKGKTKHAPSIFLFIDKLIIDNSFKDFASFNFSLKGLEGGHGGNGGVGGDGAKGSRGRKGRQGSLLRACRKGGTGKQGGRPGPGGRGGDGGCGGDGPRISIYYGEESIRPVLERSKYVVSGGQYIYNPEDPISGAGSPGDSGKPGPGGQGGKRAGNCNGGNVGPEGVPSHGSADWSNFNFGHGLPSTYGKEGDYNFDPIDSAELRIVFNDPEVTDDKTNIKKNSLDN